jgi:hypothetical protein
MHLHWQGCRGHDEWPGERLVVARSVPSAIPVTVTPHACHRAEPPATITVRPDFVHRFLHLIYGLPPFVEGSIAREERVGQIKSCAFVGISEPLTHFHGLFLDPAID